MYVISPLYGVYSGSGPFPVIIPDMIPGWMSSITAKGHLGTYIPPLTAAPLIRPDSKGPSHSMSVTKGMK